MSNKDIKTQVEGRISKMQVSIDLSDIVLVWAKVDEWGRRDGYISAKLMGATHWTIAQLEKVLPVYQQRAEETEL